MLNQNTGIRNAWKQDWHQISHWQSQTQEDKKVIAQKFWEAVILNLDTFVQINYHLWRQNLNNFRQVSTQFTTHRLPLKELPYNVFQEKEKRIHKEKLGCKKQCWTNKAVKNINCLICFQGKIIDTDWL